MGKVIKILLSLILIANITTFNVYADPACHCGNSGCICNGWMPIESLSGISASGGNYYLAKDILNVSKEWTIDAGSNVNLCLNGKTISTSGHIGDYLINVYGTLSITDCSTSGKIVAYNANGLFNVSGSGKLNIDNGNFITARHGKNLVNAVSGGTVNIKGGTFSNSGNSEKKLSVIYGILVSSGSGSTINVSGGNFKAQKITYPDDPSFAPFLINSDGKGKLNISGGNFEAEYYGYSTYSFDTTTITGGTFKTKSSPSMSGGINVVIAEKLPANYELIDESENDSGPYRVEKIKAFKINKDYYSTLSEAMSGVSNGQKIIVLRDVNLTETYNIDKDITIDLNGFTATETGANSPIFNVVGNGKLTINDSSTSGSGRLTAYNTSRTLIKVNGGELVVNGGNFDVKVDNYVSYTHVINCFQGEVTLNDGNFTIKEGCDTKGNNLYSSVVAATKSGASGKSIVNIKGGTYNCTYSTSESGVFASRIFTPYKDGNVDFGTINVSGGKFNGDYNNVELTEIKNYLKITGGSFDRQSFSNDLQLKDMIDTNYYKVEKSNENPARYNVVSVPKKDSNVKGYVIVNTGVK